MTYQIACVLFLILCTRYSIIGVEGHNDQRGNLAVSAQDYKTVVHKNKEKHFYDLFDRDIYGREVQMSQFDGKVVVVVNVASEWGLTARQYTELKYLFDIYGQRGLTILAFPCNQFANEEPGTNEEILAFAEEYDAHNAFVFFEKGDVNGENAREVYEFLKNKLPNDDGSTDIQWNFSKFLIDRKGNPQHRYAPKVRPLEMIDSIEDLLDQHN